MAISKIVTNSLSDDAVTAAKIATGTIVAADLAADSVDSSELVNGSIDTAHIDDNQVTLAKMAGIVRGKIIYGDSSGNPAVLTVGSSGQALVSDGTDISWGSGGAISTYSNSTNNRVITSVDSSSVNSEANLTFDGSVLAATGNITATGTIEPAGDTAADDNAAIGYTSAEGLILTGQGSTNDVTIKNDADADVIKIPTGTTNVTIVGDLTVTGDDLLMATNTSGAALIADGTNFNPVVISGDATIATNGALTVANNAVSLAKMAGLARGKLIYGDSSGDPAALAVGSANQLLQHDGTDLSWATVSSGTAWQAIATGATTMVSGRGYFVNTTSSAFTMTLPASPSLGDYVSIIDYAGTFDSNTRTIGRNSQKIQGASADMTVTTERAAFTLVFVDATHGWLLTNK